jgi:hypothetical protein
VDINYRKNSQKLSKEHVAPPSYHISTTNRHVLTDYEKGQIEGQGSSKRILADITLSLNILLSTIGSYLDRKNSRYSCENLPRPGRPRESSVQDDRVLIRKAKANTKVSVSHLGYLANSSFSNRSIRHWLIKNNIHEWKAVMHPQLTKKHVEKHS